VTEQQARARDRGDAGDRVHAARAAPATEFLRIFAWAAAYAVAVWLGHLTLVGTTPYPLYWPASGVALVWIATANPRTRGVELVLLGLVGAASLAALDGTRWQVPEALIGTPVGVAVFVAVSHRLSPSVWGSGGIRPIRTLRQYGGLVAAAAGAGVAEAVVAAVVLAPDRGEPFARAAELGISHTVSMVTIGGTGLVIAAWLAGMPQGRWGVVGLPRRVLSGIRRDSNRLDLLLAATAGLAATAVLVLGYLVLNNAPVSFVLVMLVVGVAIHFSAPTTGSYALAITVAACWLTTAGQGPIAGLPDPHRRTLAFGLFAVALAVTGLTISLSRRERDAIIVQLQESEHAAEVLADDLTLVLANLEEGVAVIEEGGRFIHANAAIGRLLEMIDFDDEHVQPVDVYHLVHLDGSPLQESEVPHVRAFAGEEDVHDVVRLARTDVPGERVFELSARLLPQIRSTDKPRAVTTIRDVTAEHEQRDALASFAQVVAHDLRSPLTSIELWARELLDTYDEGPVDVATATMMLRHVESAAGRMQNFISDLLSYALARDQTPSPTRVELKDVVESVVETIAAVEGVFPDVRFDDLPGVWCDPVLVPQLFDNLIGNARKYVAHGVVPRVRIEATALPEDWARVRVIDNGIGIAPEDRVRVFETFERAGGADYDGTGLGLAICRHIVERHGGTISVATPPDDRGTCIELTLPMTDEAFDRATGARGS
jgi:signal transduction histidine kinase